MGYKCVIVDDEPLAIEILESYINFLPSLDLVAKCSNAFEAMKVLQNVKADILFLDIKMPQFSGVDLVRNLKNPPKIIFTTAFKEYAVEAFDLDAFDYLLKPISLQRFVKAISKIDVKTEYESFANQDVKEVNRPFLYFRVDRKMVKVFLDDVLYIESLKDYIKIFRDKETPLIVKHSISSLEDMLPKNQFIRVHRSFIISIDKVQAYTQQDIEIGKQEIPIGRAYQQQVKNIFK